MNIKKVIGGLLFIVISVHSFAQNWESNWNEATQKAKEENKPLVLVFQGSDWCGPCIKLEKKIWSSHEFVDYANENFVLYKADFPRKKANQLSKDMQVQNNALAEKYNVKGYFPMVVIFSPDLKVKGETGYKKLSPEEYIQHINSFLE